MYPHLTLYSPCSTTSNDTITTTITTTTTTTTTTITTISGPWNANSTTVNCYRCKKVGDRDPLRSRMDVPLIF